VCCVTSLTVQAAMNSLASCRGFARALRSCVASASHQEEERTGAKCWANISGHMEGAMGSVAGCTGLQKCAGTRPTSVFLPFRVHLRRSSRPPSRRSWPVATLSIPRPGAAVVRHAHCLIMYLMFRANSLRHPGRLDTRTFTHATAPACRAVPAFRAQRRTSSSLMGTSGTRLNDCALISCLPAATESAA